MAPLDSLLSGQSEGSREGISSSSNSTDFTGLAKSFNFNLQVKLDADNYFHWKAQVLPIIKAFDLEDFLTGLKPTPSKLVEIEKSDGTTQLVPN